MPVRYTLHPSRMTARPDDWRAVVLTPGSLGLDDLVQRIADMGSTTTTADVRAVLEDLQACVAWHLEQGWRVNIEGFVEFYPRMRGVFTGPDDSFTSGRHELSVGAKAGKRLLKGVREASTEKVARTARRPRPVAYMDLGSGTTNQTLTPGSIGTLLGSGLKFDPAQPDEGIFFLPVGGGPEIPVATNSVATNFPGKLVFLVPGGGVLAPGSYGLEVRARLPYASQLTIGRLQQNLVVV